MTKLVHYTVKGAKGREVRTGIEFSGVLHADGKAFAQFRNAGRGGCNSWDVRPDAWGRDTFAAFCRTAELRFPGRLEAHDDFAGMLWDTAMLAAVV